MTHSDDTGTIGSVTSLSGAGASVSLADLAAEAATRAADAAQAAGVVVRELSELTELTDVENLYEKIWRPHGNPPVNTELLRAFSKAGNYVAGAFDRTELVGACVGFFTPPAAGALHSHIAGVSATMLGRHVGYALKLHQRAWALSRGLQTIEWTFDPLVARNAYFNLVKLGSHPAEYLPNFYGGMQDQINGDDDTDRLLIQWDLLDASAMAASRGRWRPADVRALQRSGASVALRRGDDGRPVPGSTGAATLLVAAPSDVEALRTRSPEQAKEWRLAMRDVLGGLMADGARVTGFDRGGWYVVER
jgi:predicted GNAT superfamily acetyltransferase